jgi:hypothetical protein
MQLTPKIPANRSKLACAVELAGEIPVNSLVVCRLSELTVKTGVKCG